MCRYTTVLSHICLQAPCPVSSSYFPLHSGGFPPCSVHTAPCSDVCAFFWWPLHFEVAPFPLSSNRKVSWQSCKLFFSCALVCRWPLFSVLLIDAVFTCMMLEWLLRLMHTTLWNCFFSLQPWFIDNWKKQFLAALFWKLLHHRKTHYMNTAPDIKKLCLVFWFLPWKKKKKKASLYYWNNNSPQITFKGCRHQGLPALLRVPGNRNWGVFCNQ